VYGERGDIRRPGDALDRQGGDQLDQDSCTPCRLQADTGAAADHHAGLPQQLRLALGGRGERARTSSGTRARAASVATGSSTCVALS
jgi:hypothetical protein